MHSDFFFPLHLLFLRIIIHFVHIVWRRSIRCLFHIKFVFFLHICDSCIFLCIICVYTVSFTYLSVIDIFLKSQKVTMDRFVSILFILVLWHSSSIVTSWWSLAKHHLYQYIKLYYMVYIYIYIVTSWWSLAKHHLYQYIKLHYMVYIYIYIYSDQLVVSR